MPSSNERTGLHDLKVPLPHTELEEGVDRSLGLPLEVRRGPIPRVFQKAESIDIDKEQSTVHWFPWARSDFISSNQVDFRKCPQCSHSVCGAQNTPSWLSTQNLLQTENAASVKTSTLASTKLRQPFLGRLRLSPSVPLPFPSYCS